MNRRALLAWTDIDSPWMAAPLDLEVDEPAPAELVDGAPLEVVARGPELARCPSPAPSIFTGPRLVSSRCSSLRSVSHETPRRRALEALKRGAK